MRAEWGGGALFQKSAGGGVVGNEPSYCLVSPGALTDPADEVIIARGGIGGGGLLRLVFC